jgi:hypothetical protein
VFQLLHVSGFFIDHRLQPQILVLGQQVVLFKRLHLFDDVFIILDVGIVFDLEIFDNLKKVLDFLLVLELYSKNKLVLMLRKSNLLLTLLMTSDSF